MKANLPNIKVGGEAASADEKAASDFPETLAAISEEGSTVLIKCSMSTKQDSFGKRYLIEPILPKKRNLCLCLKATKNHLTLLLRENAARDYKLKPLLYHSENPKALKSIMKAFLSVVKVWSQGLGN